MNRLRTMIASLGAVALIAVSGTGVLAAPANLSSPAADLRVALSRLLSEHAALAMEAMRQGVDAGDLSDPEFTAAAGALQGNTDDLTAAIESVYGADAGDAFRAQWEAHIGFFVDYTVALAGDDADGQQTALDDLAGYREDFSNFLDTATEGNVPAAGAADALAAHVDQLIAAIDAYAADDFEGAYAAEREGFAHMFMTGQVLAAGIVGLMPDKFPTAPNASDTALPVPGDVNPVVLLGFGVVALSTLTLTRRAIEVRSRAN